jgi:hypothetical protein
MAYGAAFSTKQQAQDFVRRMRAEGYHAHVAGKIQTSNGPAWSVKVTPKKKRNAGKSASKRKRNPAKAISLRNFTGKIRLNPDKTVSVLGVGRKKKAAKKTAVRRRTRRVTRRKR